MAAWDIAGSLVDLVVPRECAGCAAPGASLCPDCWAAFAGPVRRLEAGAPRLIPADGGPPLPVWASTVYAGGSREAIGAWKRRGRVDLTPAFAGRLAAIGREIAPAVCTLGLSGVCAVPIPSRMVSRLRRGGRLTEQLAAGLVRGLRTGGLDAIVTSCLVRTPGARDQVGLGGRARSANREGATQVWSLRGVGRGMAAIMVDDVVTTGASLLDAERALAAAGVGALGAAVLAASPPSGQGERHRDGGYKGPGSRPPIG
ncbi:MAG: hypothetical protein LBK59_01300 [Bifidobacteriaceae bacterium]|nr:hypothetical protein [Bifidobacteriaceae bacterium]